MASTRQIDASGHQERHRHLMSQARQSHEEVDHLVRALSHDMGANFMVLDHSFERLKGLLGRLGGQGEVEEAVCHVEACLRESRRFLDDLVRLAKTGTVEMDPARLEMTRVVDEVLFEQRGLLAERKVQIDVRRPLPLVWCNEHRLKQVLTNLVRNAVRHGCHPDRPQVVISSAESLFGRSASVDRRFAWLRVWDNGPGIPAQFQQEIFLPGRRLEGAQGEGSGMGLAIVKKTVEHYGGTVRVDADCRDGTAIVFSLPVPPLHEDAPTAAEDGTQDGSLADRCLGHDPAHEDRHRHQPLAKPWDPRSRPCSR